MVVVRYGKVGRGSVEVLTFFDSYCIIVYTVTTHGVFIYNVLRITVADDLL